MLCSPQERLNPDTVQNWILRQLGAPRISVPLHPCHLADAVNDAIDWFIAEKGFVVKQATTMLEGQVVYPYPEDADAIIDVIPPGERTSLDLYYAGAFGGTAGFTNGSAPMSLFSYGPRGKAYSAGGPLSAIVQSEQYLEQSRRVTSTDFNWWVDTGARTVHISPTPRTSGPMEIRYITRNFSWDALPHRDYVYLRDYALARAKMVLGEILRRFASIPSAQGSVSMNGQDLVTEAKASMDELTESLRQSSKPLQFVTG